jgi:hypothetical protein
VLKCLWRAIPPAIAPVNIAAPPARAAPVAAIPAIPATIGRNINLLPDDIEFPQKHSEPILHCVRAKSAKIQMKITRQLGTCRFHPKKSNIWHIPPAHGFRTLSCKNLTKYELKK